MIAPAHESSLPTTPHAKPNVIPRVALFAAVALAAPSTASAEPWRLSDRLPDGLKVEVHNQSRFEYLDEHFQAGLTGSDQYLSLRTGVFAEAHLLPALRVGGEVVDVRGYFADDETPLDTAYANPLDVLQAYVAIDGHDAERSLSLLLGRFTLDLGSRRFVARNRYRATINAFTGAHAHYVGPQYTIDAFASLAVARKPTDRDELADNRIVFDTESFDAIFWGVYVRRAIAGVGAETFVFGRHDDRPDGRRDLLTPGLRFVRNAKPGTGHFEFEVALQFGSAERREHLAAFVATSAGYTFDVWSKPSVTLLFEYSTGDGDPNDDESTRFDRLYGVPRPEYGPTMLYLAFNRGNLATPGVRVVTKPFAPLKAIATLRSFALAEAEDAWLGSGYRDRTGRSGAVLGEQIELRVQYDVLPDNVRIEAGFAHLWRRGFAVAAARGAPTPDPTIGYLQLEMSI